MEGESTSLVADLITALRCARSLRSVGALFERALEDGHFTKLDPRTKTTLARDGYLFWLGCGPENSGTTSNFLLAGSTGFESAPRLVDVISLPECHVYVTEHPNVRRFQNLLDRDVTPIDSAAVGRLRKDLIALSRGGVGLPGSARIHALAMEDEAMRCWFVTDRGQLALTGWESLRTPSPREIAAVPERLDSLLRIVRVGRCPPRQLGSGSHPDKDHGG